MLFSKTSRRVCALLLLSFAAPLAYAELPLRGEFTQGGLIVGKAEPGSRVWFKGVELKLTPQGEFVLGLDRDEGPEVWIREQKPGAEPASRRYPVRKREYDIQRVDGLPPDKVEPPASALKRIAQDAQQLKAARLINSDQMGFVQAFAWPVTGRISGVFGSQRILNGVPKSPHAGVDVAVPTGTELRAPADGVISLAVPDMYYTGGTLVIDHGHGLSTMMIHLSRLIAQQGQSVKQGEVVGLAGMTGRATGPHLHWAMNWLGARLDPQLAVPPMSEVAREKSP